ncbi:hypothetical protein HQ560_05570 [bacterium]|nr:hypothetical protein [bacterium]
MSDEKFDDLIDLYAAGELDAAARTSVETYIEEHPDRVAELNAARERQSALEARLASHRVSDGFVERTMVAIQAAAPATAPVVDAPPERLVTRIFRFAAMAAAASLLLAGSYGMMSPGPAGRIAAGSATRVSANRTVNAAAGATLACGDVVKTTGTPGDFTRISLAQGRLRGALAPGSRLQVCDERKGSIALLHQGDLFWRASSSRAAPVVDTPLIRVAAMDGDMSLHVKPSPQATGNRFRGTVVLAAHRGAAQVFIPGRRRGPITIRGGQMLTLHTGVRRIAQPQNPDIVCQKLRESAAQKTQAFDALKERWEAISEAVRGAPKDAQWKLFEQAAQAQAQMRQTRSDLAKIHQAIQRLERCRTNSRQVFPRLASDEP